MNINKSRERSVPDIIEVIQGLLAWLMVHGLFWDMESIVDASLYFYKGRGLWLQYLDGSDKCARMQNEA